MSNEALSQLPHKLATLIKCLPQAPFREHLAAECIKQSERIAELELQPAFAQLASDLAVKLAATEAERDQLRAEVERLRGGLLETARMVEDLKRPVSMDNPDSPQAARNSLYMSISYFARAIEAEFPQKRAVL